MLFDEKEINEKLFCLIIVIKRLNRFFDFLQISKIRQDKTYKEIGLAKFKTKLFILPGIKKYIKKKKKI